MPNIVAVAGRAAAVLAGMFFYQRDCLAQSDPWERLKLIEQGKTIEVKLRAGKSTKGKFESWSADTLQLRQGSEIISIEKSGVQRAALMAGMSRARRAMWAGLIGGAAGAGLMGASCAGSSNCDVDPGAMAAGGALFIGGIAAGIAVLIPQHKEVLYVAPEVPKTARALGRKAAKQDEMPTSDAGDAHAYSPAPVCGK